MSAPQSTPALQLPPFPGSRVESLGTPGTFGIVQHGPSTDGELVVEWSDIGCTRIGVGSVRLVHGPVTFADCCWAIHEASKLRCAETARQIANRRVGYRIPNTSRTV